MNMNTYQVERASCPTNYSPDEGEPFDECDFEAEFQESQESVLSVNEPSEDRQFNDPDLPF